MALSFEPQTANNLIVAEVTVAQSASASDVIPTSGNVPVAVFSDPTTTDVTTTHFKIQTCLTSSGTFVDAVDASGNVIKAPAIAPKQGLFSANAYAPFIKLVAITSGEAADAQSALRTLHVVLRMP